MNKSTNIIVFLKNDVRMLFRNVYKDLTNLIMSLIKDSFYSKTDISLEKKMKKIGLHSSDVFILLDCYTLAKNQLDETVAFITRDKGILSCRERIEKIFDTYFPILDPKDYLS